MRISAINTNYNYQNNNINRKNAQQPNFQGAMSDKLANVTINRLAKMNNEVFEKFSAEALDKQMSKMIEKYSCLGTKSAGIMVVNQKDLPALLGKNINKFDVKNKMGLCVAVGDKFGPIENMTNIYEAKTFLLTEKELKKNNL